MNRKQDDRSPRFEKFIKMSRINKTTHVLGWVIAQTIALAGLSHAKQDPIDLRSLKPKNITDSSRQTRVSALETKMKKALQQNNPALEAIIVRDILNESLTDPKIRKQEIQAQLIHFESHLRTILKGKEKQFLWLFLENVLINSSKNPSYTNTDRETIKSLLKLIREQKPKPSSIKAPASQVSPAPKKELRK
ncbi:MAG: hypothetical protein ACOY3I_10150 [Verrucomicrobiota bacterium]